MRTRIYAYAFLAFGGLALPLNASAQTPAKLEFTRDIQPVFKAHCYACHASDGMGGLRLDSRASALHGGTSGPVILPGSGSKSLIMLRILGQGGKPRMPLGFAPLSAADAGKILRWIDEGAAWKDTGIKLTHWAFIPPRRPPLPRVRLRHWALSPIDTFILARMEKEGLRPSPPADRSTLIRRVYLDLTGVPPTPWEVDQFLKDRSPGAYEKVVDRCLASQRYGERMAMDWLDGARYADSNGYQADYERYQWRWRDWVINAFNRNERFNQFTIDQIAGDLLPHPTLDQRIATGFNRNHRINTEGGIIPEEWRVENVVDRVETTSQVWLALTVGCARCHDHKYDPILQKDFYSFFSYFNNVPETGTGVEQPVNHPPFIRAPTPEQQQKLDRLTASIKLADAWLTERVADNAGASQRWRLASGRASGASLLDGVAARYVLSAHPRLSAGAGPAPTISGAVSADPGHSTGAVVTAGGSYVDLGSVGDFDTHDSFSYGAWVNPADGNGSPLSKMDSSANFQGWDVLLEGGRPAIHVISHWPDNALKIVSRITIPIGRWSHLFVTYDGSAKPEGMKLFINGKPVEFDTEVNALTGSIRTAVSTKIGSRTGSSPFSGKVDDVVLYHRAVRPDEVAALVNGDPARTLLAVPAEKRTPEQQTEIARLWSQRFDPDFRVRQAVRDSAEKERSAVDSQVTTVMVMEEMPQPRKCTILQRGQYDKPGAVVTAAIPSAFGKLPPGAPNNRLGLAEWIVSPSNPFTARVAVNRLWEKFFGAGIVRTTEDFGMRSSPPTHPELLDWLATEFVRTGWDLKAIQKEIVMSATYRQSARLTPLLREKDPENRLLARGPRFRLPAEIIRDQALAVAGLLTEKVGGPSVRPYQPEGIWDETSTDGNLHNYKHDRGANLYRRSLYTIWKRTAAPPEMTLFDAPSREVCRVRRDRTDTPLQALVLLNDETYVESARVLAQGMLSEGGFTTASRIRYGFRRALCRFPSEQELQILEKGTEKRLAAFQANPDEAARLVKVGDSPLQARQDIPTLGAFTLTASIILNMDEMITRG